MKPPELRERAQRFAVAVLALCGRLRDPMTRDRAAQLQRAADSAAINYRAACDARNHDEFVAKICIVSEEMDEAQGWLALLIDNGVTIEPVDALYRESTELAKIFGSSKRTALKNQTLRRARKRRR